MMTGWKQESTAFEIHLFKDSFSVSVFLLQHELIDLINANKGTYDILATLPWYESH